MAKIKPQLFAFLHGNKIETILSKLYIETLKQGWSMIFHSLPKVFKIYGRGIDCKTEKESGYDDKYTLILPTQVTFLHRHERALNAENIIEFGTSFDISAMYLAKAAKDNVWKVISTEYRSHKFRISKTEYRRYRNISICGHTGR